MTSMILNVFRGIALLIFGMATYIVKDFQNDLVEGLNATNDNMRDIRNTVEDMNDSVNILNTTMATMIVKDQAKDKRLDRLEKDLGGRIERLEDSYFRGDLESND